MGYCYGNDGGLLCDACSGPGGVKRRCRYGWHQPFAICQNEACLAGHAEHVRNTCASKCKPASEAASARKTEEERLTGAGCWVRCSAVSEDLGRVRVYFYRFGRDFKPREYASGTCSTEAYRAVPLLNVAQPYEFDGLDDLKPERRQEVGR
jgi:hypothetical protein